MRSIAQKRLTAVGRVPAISSHVFWNSAANFCVPVALLFRMPTAMPIAAATPIAGAPRITIVLIARATSAADLQRTYTSSAGSFRWSIITTTSASRAIVGNIGSIVTNQGRGAEVLRFYKRFQNRLGPPFQGGQWTASAG